MYSHNTCGRRTIDVLKDHTKKFMQYSTMKKRILIIDFTPIYFEHSVTEFLKVA